ncbi:putative alpha glucoside I/Mannosyl oligosaccharide glucosidase [Teratosphaeria nubilosa]|uniref:Mannosyl-oligosaccharide glucosidase n=1 Tax=Teratosphaeria nubilosa TaxID=161662 RepID=A0A6G1KWL9_9PEZI|nr:putative alpha glucoside I/Mannosyl oligosaccharide glucosidase [Teratosphaeria nubilosa]
MMAWKRWALAALFAVSTSAQEGSVFSKQSNDSLLWGPYRPNLYFGVRPRLPKSLTTGLLWGRVEDFDKIQHNIRYTCEQHEGMAGYGWDAYDPRTGGVQTVHDRGNGIDIETSFVKMDGGAWGARIKGTPREDAEPQLGSEGSIETMKTAVWFTVGMEGLGTVSADGADEAEELGYPSDVLFSGAAQDLGDFKLTITEPSSNTYPIHRHPAFQTRPLDHTFVHSLQVLDEAIWQSKALLFASLKTTIDNYVQEYTQDKMPPPWQTYTINHQPGAGNMHIVQKVFEGPFEFDVLYAPADNKAPPTSEDLTAAIDKVVKNFDEKFNEVLEPKAPFTASKYLDLGKSLFSNLIGGIGYFYGDQVIDRSHADAYLEENEGFWQEAEEARGQNQFKLEGPYELYTSIPSRPFFPRGFLWDEGFHLLPIVDWDPELAMQIVSSWFNTMDEDGWIPREQILGSEARSKVPQEFQVQYPHYANPPTLYMTIEALLEKFKKDQIIDNVDQSSAKAWLTRLYPLLQRNFEWYKKTQFGDLKSYDRPAFSNKEGYRWRGRTPRHILTSGLDDYPRAQPPHPGELHLDLISWMGMAARIMAQVAAYIGENEDAKAYSKTFEAIVKNIDDLHWSSKDKAYCDATIDDYEDSVHVCHKGYISIFPLMTGMLGPKSEHLEHVLDLIADEDELWSPHGIRSLSKQSEFYMTDENYWRSPVWININYLIVKALGDIAANPGPQQAKAAKMYEKLRSNLVNTVYESWKETGFAWEQYNPETGAGQRTQHFTGWTSLIVKIMNFPEIKGVSGGERDEL